MQHLFHFSPTGEARDNEVQVWSSESRESGSPGTPPNKVPCEGDESLLAVQFYVPISQGFMHDTLPLGGNGTAFIHLRCSSLVVSQNFQNMVIWELCSL